MTFSQPEWTGGSAERQPRFNKKGRKHIKMFNIGLFAAVTKIPPLVKITAAGLAVMFTAMAAIGEFDFHNIWFDYVLFIVFSAIISGMPEPDTELQGWRFFYTWAYRSGHLMVASATAYFMHNKQWEDISGKNAIKVEVKELK